MPVRQGDTSPQAESPRGPALEQSLRRGNSSRRHRGGENDLDITNRRKCASSSIPVSSPPSAFSLTTWATAVELPWSGKLRLIIADGRLQSRAQAEEAIRRVSLYLIMLTLA